MIKEAAITAEQGGVRLDAALFHAFPTSSRAFVRQAIASGAVLVDGRPAFKGQRLRGGETIAVRELAECADNQVRPNAAVQVFPVYEDASLLAYDKPAGQSVHPLRFDEEDTLMNGVVARHPECVPLGDRPLMAGALHRIDAMTTGLVLVARTAAAFANVRAQFAAREVEKTYLALVEGEVRSGGTIELDLAHDPHSRQCRMIDAHRNRLTNAERAALRPLHAVTRYEPLATRRVENEIRTLLKVVIFTGVTHQIRASLALAGMHIVNDRLYGAFAVEGMEGHCLHSLSARFRHPETGEELEIATKTLPTWAS